ncbi:MAG TPA: alpha/beta fold hydrolase [Kofleriaceae bacterium]|nr:alpha/beta fold hydrolase [Kofleriaceae bacterium]
MRARVGDVELEYVVHGADDATPLVIVMGLGAQMVLWDERFVRALVERGFRVIAFDNRDVGASTRLDHLPVPPPIPVLARSFAGLPIAAPYTLSDMARDTIGLMDHLAIDRAHVLGVSMGGMIAQHLAIEHPRRVLTLTSIMSSPGGRYLPRFTAMRALMKPMGKTVAEAEQRFVDVWRVIGSPAYPLEEDRLRRVAREAFARGASPRGFLRQLAAIAASGDRRARLRKVATPSLVIHGREDPLIPARAGRATARALRDARYLEMVGMGHDLPPALHTRFADEVADLADRTRAD